MDRLDEAYQSLDIAKKEEAELRNENNKYLDIYNFIVTYCRENTGYRNVDGELLNQIHDINVALKVILLALLLFAGVFGVLDLIAISFFNRWSFVYTSLGAGIGSFSVAIRENIKDMIKARKSIKQLKIIKSLLEDEEEFRNKPLKELLHLFGKRMNDINDILREKRSAISEYERELAKVNNELAEEIMLQSGIPATVSLNSNMKILSKRYEDTSSVKK